MTAADHTDDPTIRSERFSVSEPPRIDVTIGSGNVNVELATPPHSDDSAVSGEVTVELRHAPSTGPSWQDGMTAMWNLFGRQFAEQFAGTGETGAAAALSGTRLERTANGITVEAPSTLPLCHVPLAVTVYAPAGSALVIRTGAAPVTVTGKAGPVELSTSSGDITLTDTSTRCRARTGTGTLRLGAVREELNARAGSGPIEVTSTSGTANAVTSSGSVWFGEVTGNVLARTGSGNIAVADAGSGTIELNTGSGDLRIGIGTGVTGEIDISSGTGRVVSELDVAEDAPAEDAALRVHARTGTGNAVLRRSGL